VATTALDPALLHLGPEPPDGWDDLVRPGGSVFARPAWVDAVREGMGRAVHYAALLGPGGRAEVGLLMAERRVPGFRMMHSFLPYGGPVGDRSRTAELFELLLPRLRKMGFHDLAVEDPDPELPPGLEVVRSDAMRHVLDLSRFGDDPDALLPSLSSNTRHTVRKSFRLGAEVRSARDEDVDAVYDLYLQAMARNDAPAWYPRELLQAIQRRMNRDEFEFLVAWSKGEAVAVVGMARSADASHYWMGGNQPAAFEVQAMDLLFHTAITDAISRGHRWFDFMGTRRDDAGLRRYKEKWGAEPVEVAGYHVELSPWRAKAFRKVYHLTKQGPLAAVVRKVRGG
jgi:hypothetical protein